AVNDDQAKRRAKRRPQRAARPLNAISPCKIFFVLRRCTSFSRSVNRFSTATGPGALRLQDRGCARTSIHGQVWSADHLAEAEEAPGTWLRRREARAVECLDGSSPAHYAEMAMNGWGPGAAAALLLLAGTGIAAPPSTSARGMARAGDAVQEASPPSADDGALLLRVFLRDGSSLVSYGEFARVNDRVIFSLPTASTPNPPLQLVNLPADRVDWERTTRYAERARAARYIATRAEQDFIALSNSVSRTLNEVAFAPDAAARLELVERARRTLADWPRQHFNYKSAEVRQLLSMLDETIADLRVAAGGRFDLSVVAVADEPPPNEPLQPPPTPIESIEGLLTAARFADAPSDRQALLSTALARLDA